MRSRPSRCRMSKNHGRSDDRRRALGAESRHRVLERARPAVLVERQGLAVEDHPLRGEGAHHVDDLGDPMGDVGEVAGVDPHVVAVAVHLDPGAVELVFDGCRDPESRERLRHRARRRGEHRHHRAADHEPHRLEVLRGAGEGDPPRSHRDLRRASRPVGRSPPGARRPRRSPRAARPRGRRCAARPGSRGRGSPIPPPSPGPRAPRARRAATRRIPLRPAAASRLSAASTSSTERVALRGVRDLEPGDAAPPDPDTPLPRAGRQKPDRRRDLVGGELAQHAREGRDLREPGRCGRRRSLSHPRCR